ncbi:MAG: MATE family efflux transporter, partial [Candidatus Methanomethylophilaceae archaeon]
FIIMDEVLSGILRPEGAAKRSMIMLSSSAVVNMILDPLLIYGAGLGLSGAGWATGLSTVVSTCIGLSLYLGRKQHLTLSFKGFRFKTGEMWDVLYVGIPRATESILISLMSLLQRIFVIACGGVAGSMFYNIPWRFVSLACVISMAVSAAMIPVCSAALGQKDMDKAAEGCRYALKISFGSMSIIAILLFVFSEWCVIPFTYSPSMAEYRSEFAHVLRIYAPIVVCMGFVDIGSAILQTLRMAQYSMISAFLRNLIIMGFLYFASMVSMDAIYYSLLISEIIGGAMMMGLARSEFSKYTRREGKPIDIH